LGHILGTVLSRRKASKLRIKKILTVAASIGRGQPSSAMGGGDAEEENSAVCLKKRDFCAGS